MIRVVIPYHLKMLAKVSGEIELDVPRPSRLKAALDALEARFPMLCGTIRDQVRRANAGHSCGSLPASRTFRTSRRIRRLPEEIVSGEEPLLVVGAIAGG